MNLEKVKKALGDIGERLQLDILNDGEFLILVANMLIQYGKAGIQNMQKFQDLNINNANQVELTFAVNPEDVHLAAILQGHVLIKWANHFKD